MLRKEGDNNSGGTPYYEPSKIINVILCVGVALSTLLGLYMYIGLF